MKTTFLALFLSLCAWVPGAYSQDAAGIESSSGPQRYASGLPQTLVVRKAPNGQIAIYHSSQMLPKGSKLNPSTPFTTDFPRTMDLRRLSPDAWYNWYFYWGYPYYSYYPSYYYYGYNYNYYPYYSYYGNYGYNYYYYRWRWW